MKRFYLRSSSIPALFDCPARWESQHIHKLDTGVRGANASLGTALHASTSDYDIARVNGINNDLSITNSQELLVDTLYHPEMEVDWGDTPPEKLEPIAISLHRNYCEQISPQFNFVGVELTCHELEIDFEDIGITIVLTGTVDRIYKLESGELGIVDIKSGKQAVTAEGHVNTKKHLYQLGAYEIMASYMLGERMSAPATVIGLQTNSKARVGIGQAGKVAAEVLIGTPEQPGMLHYAANMFKSGLFPGNPSSMMCHKTYCPIYKSCRFRG